jgi:hypothetical protein
MRSNRAWLLFASLAILASSPADKAWAQEGTILRAAVKETLEFFGAQAERQGGKVITKELAEFGGEVALRETFEQVAKESGEEGVKNLVRLSKSYGIDALRAAKAAPRLTAVVDGIPREWAPGALRALARPEERAVLSKIDAELMPSALEAAATHPGVGAQLVDNLGSAGVLASRRFDTDTVIRLLRSAETERIAAMPLTERKGLIAAMAQFIESHPKTVFDSACLALFVRCKDQILGGEGHMELGPDGKPVFVPETGIVERGANRILTWILPIVAAIIGLWGANRVFWAWRWSKLSHAVRAANLAQLTESADQAK